LIARAFQGDLNLNYDLWQKNEEEKIAGLDNIVDKLELGHQIDIWDIIPELELDKTKIVWGMLSPDKIREGYLESRPQIYLLPINAPQKENWSFKKEYGHDPDWFVELIKTSPDRIKPIITSQPLDYKTHSEFEKIFDACTEVYGEQYPPCSQWRVESLIAKYRLTCDETFSVNFSENYSKLGKNSWASRVMDKFGFNLNTNPQSIKGRQLRYFLAINYSLASFGLDELVEHVIDVCSSLHGSSPQEKMDLAMKTVRPYYSNFLKPLRSDLGGFHITTDGVSSNQKLQLALPFSRNKQKTFDWFAESLTQKIKMKETEIDLLKKLETGAPLELILRVNDFLENRLVLPKNFHLRKTVHKKIDAIDSEYGKQLYAVWHSLYHDGAIEKRVLDKTFQLSENYTKQVQEIVLTKLNKKVKVEKVKTVSGSLLTTVLFASGLTGIWELSLAPMLLPTTFLWSLGTGVSFYGVVKEVKDLLDLDNVIKEKINKKLKKNILKGNIISIEMLHKLTY
jgi:hypothetical protein